MSYSTIILAYHPRGKKGSKKPNPSKGNKPQQILQQKQTNQTNTNLMIEIQISVLDGVIPHMHKDLTAWLRSTNANIAQKLDTSQRSALQKMHTCSHSNIIKVSQTGNQIIVPEHSTKQYQNTCNCDNDDDFMIAYQLHAQPQKSVHNQRVTTGYTQKCLYANIPYRLQPYHEHNKYLHVQLDTCANVNLMPESVYKLVFNDPQTSKLVKNDIDLTVYTRHSADLIDKCTFYMLSKGTKQPVRVDFYIAKEEGSVLLSWETVFQLQLLNVKPRLEYPEQHSYPVQQIILKRRYMHSLCLHNSQIQQPYYPLPNLKYSHEDTLMKVRIIKTKEQIQEQYPELFKGIG